MIWKYIFFALWLLTFRLSFVRLLGKVDVTLWGWFSRMITLQHLLNVGIFYLLFLFKACWGYLPINLIFRHFLLLHRKALGRGTYVIYKLKFFSSPLSSVLAPFSCYFPSCLHSSFRKQWPIYSRRLAKLV